MESRLWRKLADMGVDLVLVVHTALEHHANAISEQAGSEIY